MLADVMTDKATVEMPSPVAGKVVWLGGEVGDMIAVGAELVRLEVEAPATRRAAHARRQRDARPAARRTRAAREQRAGATDRRSRTRQPG